MTMTVTQSNRNVQQEQVLRDSVMTNQLNNSVVSLRDGEGLQPTTFRVERIFSSDNNWYFSTREAGDQGPFLSRDSAEHGIKKYIKDVEMLKKLIKLKEEQLTGQQ